MKRKPYLNQEHVTMLFCYTDIMMLQRRTVIIIWNVKEEIKEAKCQINNNQFHKKHNSNSTATHKKLLDEVI